MNDIKVRIASFTARHRIFHGLIYTTKLSALSGILFFASPSLFAQIAVAPPAPVVALRSPADLQTMLGAIALYPDPLIAQILPAATVPEQIVMADRFVSGGNDLNAIDLQPWDQSVKAVARYPDVLKMLDNNLDWTTALGQAFLYQPQDVMDAIQRLRSQALALGNLQSTPQQTVFSDSGIIEILPANPTVVYVPVYQPSIVFYQRRPLNGFYVSFGYGFSIGAWLNHDLDWRHHNVIVWGAGHARPSGWWKEPPRQRFQDVRVAHDFRVWQPRNHDIRGDRGWNAPAVHREVSPPARVIERPQSRPESRPESRPPSRPESHPQPAPHAQPPPRVVESHPRPANGALIGVNSARDTRQFSNRGQQSRAVAKPAARPPVASRPTPPTRSPAAHAGDRQQGRK